MVEQKKTEDPSAYLNEKKEDVEKTWPQDAREKFTDERYRSPKDSNQTAHQNELMQTGDHKNNYALQGIKDKMDKRAADPHHSDPRKQSSYNAQDEEKRQATQQMKEGNSK